MTAIRVAIDPASDFGEDRVGYRVTVYRGRVVDGDWKFLDAAEVFDAPTVAAGMRAAAERLAKWGVA